MHTKEMRHLHLRSDGQLPSSAGPAPLSSSHAGEPSFAASARASDSSDARAVPFDFPKDEEAPNGQPSGIPNWITSLEEELDKKLLVVLRDGRKLIGFFRTFDQFGNMVLEETIQRVIVDNAYADLYVGCMIIRGDNMILFGAVDDTKPTPLEAKPLCEVLAARQEREEREREKRLQDRNWSAERQLGADYDEW
ncbi:LSM domain-containing protein [Besnoitia besnoiti]|uniref:U6 snRNA-associated Sm-like protein LSm1 n=1 Tax=Besnoitia besnoiti TaxID=94643 RepID=A0A2A9MDQ5_BESBE|nr:LSM domain-containing protein [Besnoitia besnoiti]PFH33757.1 LSM domain-containing protein [Besnoitia besnoiti]